MANTPKTLKEIMPVLMNTLISSLASSSSERRQVVFIFFNINRCFHDSLSNLLILKFVFFFCLKYFQVAGRSLGELVRKLGERVLPLIIPILSQGLKDPNPSRRQVSFLIYI